MKRWLRTRLLLFAFVLMTGVMMTGSAYAAPVAVVREPAQFQVIDAYSAGGCDGYHGQSYSQEIALP